MVDSRDVMAQLEQLLRAYYSEGYAGDLRPAQWQALRYFEQAGEGERTLTAFARARATTLGTASMTVSGLVERGLMERSHGERNVGLRLSADGKRLLDSRDPYRRIERALTQLSDGDRRALMRASDAIIQAVEEPAPESCS